MGRVAPDPARPRGKSDLCSDGSTEAGTEVASADGKPFRVTVTLDLTNVPDLPSSPEPLPPPGSPSPGGSEDGRAGPARQPTSSTIMYEVDEHDHEVMHEDPRPCTTFDEDPRWRFYQNLRRAGSPRWKYDQGWAAETSHVESGDSAGGPELALSRSESIFGGDAV